MNTPNAMHVMTHIKQMSLYLEVKYIEIAIISEEEILLI